MSDQAVLTPPEREDISAQLQERVRAFTSFYEQHAYLAYNLALRIAGEQEPAMRAVHRAFLGQLDGSPAGLVPATVESALQEARSHVDPSAAGDAEAQTLMGAMSELSPPERAAIAMADLAHAGPDAIGEALGVPGDQAAKLLHRGREAFSARLGVPRTQADEAARDWMWAAPPNEIWEELYPQFHRAVERQLRRGKPEQTLVLTAAEAAPASARTARRRRRLLRRRPFAARRWLSPRRMRWWAVLPAVGVIAVGGAAAARLIDGGGSSSSAPAPSAIDAGLPGDQPPSGPATGDSTAKPHKPLTAALLDKLRLRELRQLRQYTKRQTDNSLSVRQRRAAERRVAALERTARARLREQRKRERALLDYEARQRARAKAPPPPPAPTTRRTAPDEPKRDTTDTTTPTRTKEDTEETCLLNQDTGEYICGQ